jgi:4-amino-4-deoxy-L-arabinose transferase-like glycosyltransferase
MASGIPAFIGPGRRGPLAWITASPGQAFAAFLALHAAVWTVLPTLLYPNLPLDLIEALTYGREWQLGYDKLPPLPWWMVQIAYQLVGRDFAYYLLAETAVVAALVLVFATARPLVGAVGALMSVLIIDGLHYLNYTAAKFNHDVIQLPFWALAGFAFRRALRGGPLTDWLLLGLALGLSLWAKYFVVVLAAPLALFLLFDRDARKMLATPGPYVAAATALITAAPHLVWLVKADFLPFAYAEHRAILPRGWYDHLWHPLKFTLDQLFFLLPSMLIAVPLYFPHGPTGGVEPSRQADAYDHRIVSLLAFGPMATVLAMSAVSGRGTVALWGYPLWLFFGLWLVMTSARAPADWRLARIVATWAIVFVCLALAFVINYDLLPRFDHRYRAVFFPGASLGREIAQRYETATGKPLYYVVGTMWDGGNVAHYSPSQPRVFIDGAPQRAPWIDLSDLKARGAAVVWTDSDPNKLPAKFAAVAAGGAVQTPFTLPYRRGPGSVTVGWAILPPMR